MSSTYRGHNCPKCQSYAVDVDPGRNYPPFLGTDGDSDVWCQRWRCGDCHAVWEDRFTLTSAVIVDSDGDLTDEVYPVVPTTYLPLVAASQKAQEALRDAFLAKYDEQILAAHDALEHAFLDAGLDLP